MISLYNTHTHTGSTSCCGSCTADLPAEAFPVTRNTGNCRNVGSLRDAPRLHDLHFVQSLFIEKSWRNLRWTWSTPLFFDLVGGLEHDFDFSIIYGLSSFPLTNSICFKMIIAPPSSDDLEEDCWWNLRWSNKKSSFSRPSKSSHVRSERSLQKGWLFAGRRRGMPTRRFRLWNSSENLGENHENPMVCIGLFPSCSKWYNVRPPR